VLERIWRSDSLKALTDEELDAEEADEVAQAARLLRGERLSDQERRTSESREALRSTARSLWATKLLLNALAKTDMLDAAPSNFVDRVEALMEWGARHCGDAIGLLATVIDSQGQVLQGFAKVRAALQYSVSVAVGRWFSNRSSMTGALRRRHGWPIETWLLTDSGSPLYTQQGSREELIRKLSEQPGPYDYVGGNAQTYLSLLVGNDKQAPALTPIESRQELIKNQIQIVKAAWLAATRSELQGPTVQVLRDLRTKLLTLGAAGEDWPEPKWLTQKA